ncbi:MAG: lysyl-tRNA synthetase [Berkelbacteria bacterium GW2011_GWE1_39_12]|uniref:Lysine--tRNA ligase n=1 Tax=Berkelbacteria bacterium GW2011_GWE1_39_12 TaxID=1618337 RepID=A0A0G4B503_9BACT|nr:MAG: lysyl-tRNA synthetase [Berkelbacteria bacterium GW2011_GWE1_39_12]
MFWVDEIIEDILKKTKKDSYLVTDWKTPSGHIHVGALRGVIVHDLIRRGLSDSNKTASFQWGYDDFDPMDGMPIYIDESFDQYMGKPLCDVPAPDAKSKNFAEQYANEFTQVFEGIGIKPKIVWTSELYKEGKFNDSIRIILDHADQIKDIYKIISGSEKPKDWFPLQVICPQCGKVGTTKVISWDGEEVEFSCEENLVEWAKGCGYKGKISPFDGNAKLPWKVEWPSKWFLTGTDIEGEGKDHSAASGSRQVADEIYRKVFDKIPPYDIPYEFILLGGAKMSSSKGLGVTAKDISDLLPMNILRFLFTRTRAKRTIDFDPEGDTIPNLYDEYDRCSSAFLEDKNSDLGRAFYYAEVDLDKEQPKYLLRFSKIAYMLQMPRVDIFEYAKNEKGSALNEIEKQEIENRIIIAKNWLEKFAPESFKFNISESLPEEAKYLSSEQKEFLAKVLEEIKSKEWTGEDLHKRIHEIKTEIQINPRDAFSAIYLSFIGKESGPQAGWLLASLDNKFVINRLEEASR